MMDYKKQANPVIYALPRIGTSMLIGFTDFALFFLYHDAYGLNGLYVGIALALGKISIACTQFFLGWISDHTPYFSNFGRRKLYLFLMAPLLALSFILLVLPGLFLGSTPSQLQIFGWFIALNMLFQGLYGITTPYQAWMAELFPVAKRPKISSYQNIFNFVGTGTMIAFTMLVLTEAKDQLQVDPSVVPPLFLFSVIAFAIVVVAVFYLSAFVLPIEEYRKIDTSMIQDLKNILRDKNFILIIFMIGFASFAWSITSQYMLSFTETILGITFIGYIVLAGLMLIMIIISVLLWRKRIEKKGKKSSLLLIFLFAITVLPFSLFPLIPMSNYFIFAVFFIACVAICLGGWNLFPYLIYADLAEDDEKRGGLLKAGIYAGLPSIPLNIFQAIGLFILGLIASLPNYNFVNGSESLGYVLWGPICSLILIGVYFYSYKMIKLDFKWEKDPSE